MIIFFKDKDVSKEDEGEERRISEDEPSKAASMEESEPEVKDFSPDVVAKISKRSDLKSNQLEVLEQVSML